MNRLEVLIPCYNEMATIEQVVSEHHKLLNDSKVFDDFKIVILNDGSKDSTLELITSLSKKLYKIEIINNQIPSGIFKAFNQLYNQSSFEWIYLTSGDNQYPAKILENILNNFENNFDLYVAKRVNKFEIYNLSRQIISYFYRFFCFMISGIDPIDPGSTKLLKKNLLNEPLFCRYLARDAEIVIRTKKKGYKVKAIPVEFGNREHGKSSATKLSVLFKTYFDCLRLFKYRFF